MNLSRKIILVIICTFVALLFIVAGISDFILLNSYRTLEKKTVVDHIQQVYNHIDARIGQIDSACQEFSQELTEGLRTGMSLSSIHQRHFSEISLKSHRIDLVALYNTTGGLMRVQQIDSGDGRQIPVGHGTQRALDALASVLVTNTRENHTGTVEIGGEPFMLSARRLTGSDGVPQGLLQVGCFLGKRELKHINKVTGLVAQVSGLAPGSLKNESLRAHNELKTSGGMLSQTLDEANVSGYAHLRDLSGQPSYLVSITENRSLMKQGTSSILYILLMLLLSSSVFCGVILVFIRGAVLKRLAALSATVGDISRNGDVSARLKVTGEDELERLADSINSMLASLESSESAIRESEGRYRTLFERAPDSIFIIGTEGAEAGRIVDANDAACSQHGFTLQELRAMHIQDLNAPETNAFAADLIDRIISGEWVAQEVWHVRKDGSRLPLEIHAGLIRLAGRNYILGFDRDITSRKLTEENDRMYLERIRHLNSELADQAKKREAANKELESFNYSVSHDLRGPLTRISGYCQLVLDDEVLEPHLRTYISRIYESCLWLDEMIEGMLKLSRLTRMEYIPTPVDLSELVDQVLHELVQAEPERSAETIVAQGVTTTGDAALLKILLTNLIGNAWKYSAAAVMARIEFGVSRNDGPPVFFVSDNGAGFDMKDAGSLFRVFTRLHDQSQFSGSGIGLATAQRIITRHGGRIWAEAETGCGATFFFTLAPDPGFQQP